MIVMIENNNVDLIVEVVEADMMMTIKLIERITEKNDNFWAVLLAIWDCFPDASDAIFDAAIDAASDIAINITFDAVIDVATDAAINTAINVAINATFCCFDIWQNICDMMFSNRDRASRNEVDSNADDEIEDGFDTIDKT